MFEKKHRVFIYHDETEIYYNNKHWKGHVFLFVPKELEINQVGGLFDEWKDVYSPLEILYKEIRTIRTRYKANKKFHFTDISGNDWCKYDNADLDLMTLIYNSLRSKSNETFWQPLCCKFAIIYYPAKKELTLYGGDKKKEKKLRYAETLMRMLLKGAAHSLYDPRNRLEIEKIISDGQPHHREFSGKRVIERLIFPRDIGSSELRDYVSILPDARIVYLQASKHTNYKEGTSDYINANMLQAADMVLGSVSRALSKGVLKVNYRPKESNPCENKKCIIATPMVEVIEKAKRGKAFSNSGHYKAFNITRADIINNKWEFNTVKPKLLRNTRGYAQLNIEEVIQES